MVRTGVTVRLPVTLGSLIPGLGSSSLSSSLPMKFLAGPLFSPRSGDALRMMVPGDFGGSMCQARFALQASHNQGRSRHRHVPAGTTYLAFRRELDVGIKRVA